MKRKMFAVKLRKKFSRNGGLGDWDGVMSRTHLKGTESLPSYLKLCTRGTPDSFHNAYFPFPHRTIQMCVLDES